MQRNTTKRIPYERLECTATLKERCSSFTLAFLSFYFFAQEEIEERITLHVSKIRVSFSGALLPKQKEKYTLIFDRCSIVLSSISSCAKKYNEKNSIRETGVYGNLEGKVFLFHSCLPLVSFLCTRGNRRKNNAASVKNQGVLLR